MFIRRAKLSCCLEVDAKIGEVTLVILLIFFIIFKFLWGRLANPWIGRMTV
jgi:hypothetical protein